LLWGVGAFVTKIETGVDVWQVWVCVMGMRGGYGVWGG